jgi:hypothetical protein
MAWAGNLNRLESLLIVKNLQNCPNLPKLSSRSDFGESTVFFQTRR